MNTDQVKARRSVEHDHRVVVSSLGRFHTLQAARTIHDRGALARLITGCPAFQARRAGIPACKVKSFVGLLAVYKGLLHLTPEAHQARVAHQLQRAYDRAACQVLGEPGLVQGMSGHVRYQFECARRRGAVLVLDRSSAHIRTQDALLAEEAERTGRPIARPDPGMIQTEEAEYELADVILVPSQFAAQTFLDRGINPSKLRICPLGANYPPQVRPRPGRGPFTILYVGLMSLQKGVHDLIEAVDRAGLPAARLLLVGRRTEEMEPWFRPTRSAPWLEWHPPVARAQLRDFYRQATVFCLASIQDGFGMVITEAMACGVPVIATHNTGGPDVIEDGRQGFLVPIRSPERIAERLTELYRDRERAYRMGQAAQQKVAAGLTWADYGRRLAEVHRSVAAAAAASAVDPRYRW